MTESGQESDSADWSDSAVTRSGVPRHRHRGSVPKSSPHRVVRRAFQVLAAVLSVLLFAAFGYGFYNYQNLTSNQHTSPIRGLGAPTQTGGGSTATTAHVDGSAQNILLVGVDSRAGLSDAEKRRLKVGLSDESTSTDTIIVVHVPADGSRATLLSIPRDTYVQIPGYESGKINGAYIDGYMYGGGKTPAEDEANGQSTLVATIKNLTGLQIDHYVQVGFSGFVDIVKAIGRVPIDLCESVDDTYQHNQETGTGGGSGFKMSAGYHDLTPQQALEFVRQRHNIPGPVTDDLGREARQRYFLKQAFHEIAKANTLLNPIKLNHLIAAVDSAFTFDQDNFGIQQFAEQMSQLTSGHIVGKSIPNNGNELIGGQDVIAVNVPTVRKFAHNLFYGSSKPKAPSTVTAPPGASSSAPPSSGSSSSAPSGTDPAASGCIY